MLLDACVWGGAASVLRSEGHAVDWVGDWSADPGDERLMATARAGGQILVTLEPLAKLLGLGPAQKQFPFFRYMGSMV